MAVVDIALARDGGALSPFLRVAFTDHGLVIPPVGRTRARNLSPADILLIDVLGRADRPSLDEAVASVAARAEVDEDVVRDRLRELDEGGFLLDGAAAHAVAPAPPAPAEVVAAVEADAPLVIPSPDVFRVGPAGFELLDHHGRLRIALDALDLIATVAFRRPASRQQGLAVHRRHAGALALDADAFGALVDRLLAAGVLLDATREGANHQGAQGRGIAKARAAAASHQVIVASVEAAATAHVAAEAALAERTGVRRPQVVPVQPTGLVPSLSLGMLVAAAQQHDGGSLRERVGFHPGCFDAARYLDAVGDEPDVYLFTNYIWTQMHNLEVCRLVKERSPRSVTVFGGPDTPRNPHDIEPYLREHPTIDVIVRGEGETTFPELLAVLAGAIGRGDALDIEALRQVAGISFRDGDGVVHTEDRERITDLDTLPSPYLTGVFDAYAVDGSSATTAIIETNRGCPYGCTFCDWGAATQSRIRKFALQRVFDEIEWCATHKIEHIFLADANFGIFERDVEIAQKVAEMKRLHGYPKLFTTNYAKNTVKHLRPIVETLAGAGIITEGLLSLQSMDDETLSAIRRTNIKIEKYEALATEFRNARLPLFVDLMVGLPGSTLDSVRDDFQQCINREVTAKIFQTELLVNSPMNDPEYKEQHRIETTKAGHTNRRLVVSSASFTRDDYEAMLELRRVHLLSENFAVLRHVSRYVRQAVGIREIELYERLHRAATDDPGRYPTIAFTFSSLPEFMVAPTSWRLFVDEVRAYLVDVVGVPDDSALETVLMVQHALLPARGRQFPETVQLPHDYASWHHAMVQAKDAGHLDDWPALVPALRDLPPAPFVVSDPNRVCEVGIGFKMREEPYADWELASPVARSLLSKHAAAVSDRG